MILLFLLLQESDKAPLSDINWNTIILAVIGLVSAYLLAKMNNKSTQTLLAMTLAAQKVEEVAVKAQIVAQKTDEVAVKTDEVKNTLEKSDANTNKKLNNMHQLINSRFSKQLTISAMALRRIANESKNEEDEAAAVYAEKALLEHEAEQKEINDHEDDCNETEQ